MGLLDSLLSGMMGQSQGAQPGVNPLLQIAMQMLSAQGGAGGQGGGLAAIIEQFQRAGLGQQMNSWIGTGQNLPISPDQLTQVFGQDRMQEMAAGSGMDLGQFSGGLSDLLPKMIDGLTPAGQVPDGGVDSALAELSRMMPR